MVDVVFIDLKTAFDTVDNHILLEIGILWRSTEGTDLVCILFMK